MSRKRRSFTTEYKVEAAHGVIDSGRTIAEVARELGINEALLGRWVADERRRIEAAAASGDQPLTAAERTELARLRRQVSEQEKDIAFLKKASVNSTCQRNTLVRHELRRCSEPEALPWPVVQLGRDGIEVYLTQIPEIHSFRKILA